VRVTLTGAGTGRPGGAYSTTMDDKSPLGAFLQVKRARLSPAAVGLARHGDRRRVPGLRREELALLAGVSAGYYTRLEQGQSSHASAEVLNALASALRLTPAERDHLHVLSAATMRRGKVVPAPGEEAPAELITLLDAMAAVPALVLGRRSDVLAWNPAGHALLAGHLGFDAPADPRTRPNMSRLVFLDGPTRRLYRDWPAKARAVVGNLRVVAARHPGDAGLTALVGELVMASPDFARMWSEHPVEPCGRADYELRHPVAGDLTVTQQTLRIPQAPDQALVTVTTGP
jgi:transcriptional regulator with XRE-family HTH domain